jgi:hypothetical protein
MRRELYRLYVTGHIVVVQLALQGTHLGPLHLPFGTLRPTGKRMDAPCCDVFELADGKIKRFDCYPEGSIILTQLCVIGNLSSALEQWPWRRPIANHSDAVTTSHPPGGKPGWTSSDNHRHKEIGMSDLAGTADVIANVDGEDSYVRIQVPTNAGALDRGEQLAVVDRVTTIAADAAADRAFAGGTWVLLTEAPDGG